MTGRLKNPVPPPPEPTPEQCRANAPIETCYGQGIACWYPQMGGYVGKAVAVAIGTCTEVWVWHDGEFPFGADSWDPERSPAQLHHCDGGQFIIFGELLVRLELEYAARQQDG